MIRSVWACVALMASFLCFSPSANAASEMLTVSDHTYAFAPKADALGTVVYLHGRHGRAENGCGSIGATELGWLVCPTGGVRHDDGTFSWGAADDAHRAVARAEQMAQARGGSGPTVLVGFSQGGYLTMNLVESRMGNYPGVVIIAADVKPTRAVLERAGVRRIVLAAGRLDGTYFALKHAAKKLEAEGTEVRFVDLGHVGHTYASPDPSLLRDAIVWAGSS